MARVKVKLHRGMEAYFRKKARDSQKEEYAYLIGVVLSPAVVRVDHFRYPKEFASKSANEVQPTAAAESEIKTWASKRGLIIVGTIHSHPNWDAVLSPDDHKTHMQDCHRITGLCSVNQRKTRVRYWVAESALHCKIEWIDGPRGTPAPNAWRRR